MAQDRQNSNGPAAGGLKKTRARFVRKLKTVSKNSPFAARLKRATAAHPAFVEARTAAENDQIDQVLKSMARLEKLHISGPLIAARKLESMMCSNDGLMQLSQAAAVAQVDYPNSILLLYIRVLGLTKNGEFEAAHALVSKAILESRRTEKTAGKSPGAARKRTVNLSKIWRVVDSVARDNMAWADGEGKDGKGYSEVDFSGVEPTDGSDPFELQMSLFLAEPVLQGRHKDKYLRGCKLAFEKCVSLEERMRVIRAVWRQGLRRVPDYHAPYDLAREMFRQIEPELQDLLRPIESDDWGFDWLMSFAEDVLRDGDETRSLTAAQQAVVARGSKNLVIQTAGKIRSAMGIAKQLGFTDERHRLREALVTMAQMPSCKPAFWKIIGGLAEYEGEESFDLVASLVAKAKVAPKTNSELQDYWKWAAWQGEFQKAKKLFDRQPTKVKRDRVSLAYTTVLQRMGRFREAQEIARDVHISLLSKPHLLCPVTCFGLIRRTGDLGFAADTALNFSMVPQPTDPQGVIFVSPRSIEQLRRLPIIVLVELKRLGWAVVPLIEGQLPLEKTGIEKIDRFLGCIKLNAHFGKSCKNWMIPLEPAEVDFPNRKLTWRGIDVSHALWEEAAVNRRVYDVDFTCPALHGYLGKLAKWTELTFHVLENARQTMAELNLRAGNMISFNFRLPDAGTRFYCEEFGDPENFFCLHTANGYQNYFANFSTNVSTKCVMRNMTAHPETRSASFPVPAEFDAYCRDNKSIAAHVLESVQDVTKVKRTTVGQSTRKPEALIAMAKIREWKADGGNVACAFGKVVCDSGVPHDGGPCHADMKEWINHTIESVKGANTLLLIKPHPHEIREEIGCFMNQMFRDLIEGELPDNVMFLGTDWFDIEDLRGLIDLALIYNGTTAIEMGVMGIPALLCSNYGPVDYPIGHIAPKDKSDYRRYVRFEQPAVVAPDLKERAAFWLSYMSGERISLDYRFHARQITNKLVPPSWFDEDLEAYFSNGDQNVAELAIRAIAVPARTN